jgi:hypothetical protein
MLIATLDKHPCVAFLPCTTLRAETPTKSLSEALENIGRSHSKEAAGFGAAAKGGGGAGGCRYQNRHTCAVASGPHSVYVRAYARDSATITRVYGYSQTLDVNVSSGENKRFSCGVLPGLPLRKGLILTGASITVLFFIGLGPIGSMPTRTRYTSALVMAIITMACSWFGHSSTPESSIYLKES